MYLSPKKLLFLFYCLFLSFWLQLLQAFQEPGQKSSRRSNFYRKCVESSIVTLVQVNKLVCSSQVEGQMWIDIPLGFSVGGKSCDQLTKNRAKLALPSQEMQSGAGSHVNKVEQLCLLWVSLFSFFVSILAHFQESPE